MAWSSYALSEYLFGARNVEIKVGGHLETEIEVIREYRIGEKVVPAGYFFQPEVENVSAVIANPGGTISKFNRMGYLAGFGGGVKEIIRTGTCFRGSNKEEWFESYVSSTDYAETWSEGLTVYHNPNAKHPLPSRIFPNAAHYYFDGKLVSAELPNFHPTGSISVILLKKDPATEHPALEHARELVRERLEERFKDDQ